MARLLKKNLYYQKLDGFSTNCIQNFFHFQVFENKCFDLQERKLGQLYFLRALGSTIRQKLNKKYENFPYTSEQGRCRSFNIEQIFTLR